MTVEEALALKPGDWLRGRDESGKWVYRFVSAVDLHYVYIFFAGSPIGPACDCDQAIGLDPDSAQDQAAWAALEKCPEPN